MAKLADGEADPFWEGQTGKDRPAKTKTRRIQILRRSLAGPEAEEKEQHDEESCGLVEAGLVRGLRRLVKSLGSLWMQRQVVGATVGGHCRVLSRAAEEGSLRVDTEGERGSFRTSQVE